MRTKNSLRLSEAMLDGHEIALIGKIFDCSHSRRATSSSGESDKENAEHSQSKDKDGET